MAFGPELAVVINGSSNTRSLFFVRGGQWHALTLILDDDGDPLPGGPGSQPLGLAERNADEAARRIITAQITAYRNSLDIPDDDPLSFMKEAALVALPYLTADGEMEQPRPTKSSMTDRMRREPTKDPERSAGSSTKAPRTARAEPTITIRVDGGTVRFELEGKTSRIRVAGYGPDGPSNAQIERAKVAAREHLRSKGAQPWF